MGKIEKIAEWGRDELVDIVVGWPSKIIELIQIVADDETAEQLEDVRKSEGCPHIQDCKTYGCNHAGFNAMHAARDGKTAWRTPRGFYAYHPQPDYRPMHVTQLYRSTGGGKITLEGKTVGKPITGVDCRQCLAIHQSRK